MKAWRKNKANHFALLMALLMMAALVFALPATAAAENRSGTISASSVWNDGDVVSGAVTLSGGTAANPMTLTVNGTVTVNKSITVRGHVKIVGGGTLKRGSGFTGEMFEVNSGAQLTLANVAVNGSNVSNATAGIMVSSGGQLFINEGTVISGHKTGSRYKGAVVVYGSATMNGGSISGNVADEYGNIYIDNTSTNPAEFVLNGGTVSGNTVTDGGFGGGGFYVKYGTLTMNGGAVQNNTSGGSGGRGGGIYCTSYGTVYLNGGTISGNTAAYRGSGVFYSSRQGGAAYLYIGGNPRIADEIYLDENVTPDEVWKKYPFITSVIKNDLTLVVQAYEEGRVIAEGKDYELTNADLARVSLKTLDGSTYYAVLNEDTNQLIMSQTNPGYTKKYYVTYDANGGTGETLDNTAYEVNAQATVKANSFERAGYVFTGWNTKADGSGTCYAADEKVTVTADGVTLYAQWSTHEHQYAYSAQGNVITERCDTCTNHNATATLTAPKKEDCVYDGTAKEATVVYSGNWMGAKLSAVFYGRHGNINVGMVEASVSMGEILTATVQYEITEQAIVQHTVTFMGENGVYKQVKVDHGATIAMPEPPAKEGYTAAWDMTPDTVTGDLVIRVVYTPIAAAQNPELPQTGDKSALWLWAALLAVSLCAMGAKAKRSA